MIDKVIQDKNCISCGICAINDNSRMVMKKGIFIPVFNNTVEEKEKERLYEVCPGKGYNILEMGKELFGSENYDYRLGRYNSIGAVKSKDAELLKNSTSGALMPALANYLLDKGLVSGILTTKFEYGKDGPFPVPYIAQTKEELMLGQGSKYMPVPLLQNIEELLNFNGDIAIIGTPCQIAGIRLMQKQNRELKSKIKYTIANFCGGYRDFRETQRIFKISKVNIKNIKHFSYRGNGQPGFMRIETNKNEEVQLPYPDYARLTGYIKYHRCRLCVDATGELADISFGDAWLNEFLSSGEKWSVYISRSPELTNLLKQMNNENLLEYRSIEKDDLIKSQKGNLYTKKERQNSRYRLYRFLGKNIPKFDGGYNAELMNLKQELKVLISQNIMFFLEKIGVYLLFAKIIKRVK